MWKSPLRAVAAYLPKRIKEMLRSIVGPFAVQVVKATIRKRERNCKSIRQFCSLIRSARGPWPIESLASTQIESEIVALVGVVAKHGLRFACEIGTGLGGTFYLLCKVAEANATLITIDINLPSWRIGLLQSYATRDQKVFAIKGDSRRNETLRYVERIVEGNTLDLLFIDGDHSYSAVKLDFLNYSRFVAKGGLIAFHDIVPDYKTRYGILTQSFTGGAPRFWNEIKGLYKHFELVEDQEQDGCGIGIIMWE